MTHPLPLVGPIVAQKRKLPWVSSVLAPASFLSVYDPIVPPQWPWLYHLMRLSPWVGRGVMALATIKLDKLMQPVYDLRAELGLPRGEQPILGGTTFAGESAGTVFKSHGATATRLAAQYVRDRISFL